MMDIREKALARVRAWDRLRKHEATIMHDWPEGDEHWRWVCRAPVAEIVDWAESVERAGAEEE